GGDHPARHVGAVPPRSHGRAGSLRRADASAGADGAAHCPVRGDAGAAARGDGGERGFLIGRSPRWRPVSAAWPPCLRLPSSPRWLAPPPTTDPSLDLGIQGREGGGVQAVTALRASVQGADEVLVDLLNLPDDAVRP